VGDVSTHTNVPVSRDDGRGIDIEVGEFQESCKFPHRSEAMNGLSSTVYVDSQLSEVPRCSNIVVVSRGVSIYYWAQGCEEMDRNVHS
jgi:hypothetical protein